MTTTARKFEHLDVKTIAAWVPETSHAVASKRNTAIGLRALLHAKPIVTSEYLTVLLEAAKAPPPDANGQLQYCPLEYDFDGNFPKPDKYLPPKGSEPGNHTPEMYKPDQRRTTLFEGWTFVFCDKKQCDTLTAPITDALGKAVVVPFKQKDTIPYEIAKKIQEMRLENVAVVQAKCDDLEWGDSFFHELEKM